jgi:hypothetical protein
MVAAGSCDSFVHSYKITRHFIPEKLKVIKPD